MECRDAQFYLRFRRPGADELGPEAAADLDRHLAECPMCGPAARAEAAFDRAMGTAMTAVPIPAGLRNALVAHVAASRGAVLRRKAYRSAGLLAAAVLLVGVGLGLLNTKKAPDVDALIALFESQAAPDPHGEAVGHWLAQHNLPPTLPADFDFALHEDHRVERVQNRDVPVIVFRDRNGQGKAKVYAFREDARFALKTLREENGKSAPSSQCTVTYIAPPETPGVVYVIVHTGPTLAPFLKQHSPAI
jgi:hypothetical protein